MANVSRNSSDWMLLISPNPPVRSTLLLVTAGCLSFVGTVGNCLFILCFWLEKKLRTVSNYLITYLALADITTCLGCILVFILMANRLSTVYSCWYWLSSVPLCPIISMYCKFLISIDRAVLITQSVATYRKWFTKKLCTIYALGGWVFHAIVIALLIATSHSPEETNRHRCLSMKSLGVLRHRLIYIINIFSIIYCGMAFVSYGRLVYYVRQRRLALNSAKKAYVRTSKILLLTCVFTVSSTCISPLLIYISFSFTSDPDIFTALGEVGLFVFFLGFSINPFLYGYRIKTFRDKLKSLFMFCWIKRVIPNPSSSNNPGQVFPDFPQHNHVQEIATTSVDEI